MLSLNHNLFEVDEYASKRDVLHIDSTFIAATVILWCAFINPIKSDLRVYYLL